MLVLTDMLGGTPANLALGFLGDRGRRDHRREPAHAAQALHLPDPARPGSPTWPASSAPTARRTSRWRATCSAPGAPPAPAPGRRGTARDRARPHRRAAGPRAGARGLGPAPRRAAGGGGRRRGGPEPAGPGGHDAGAPPGVEAAVDAAGRGRLGGARRARPTRCWWCSATWPGRAGALAAGLTPARVPVLNVGNVHYAAGAAAGDPVGLPLRRRARRAAPARRGRLPGRGPGGPPRRPDRPGRDRAALERRRLIGSGAAWTTSSSPWSPGSRRWSARASSRPCSPARWRSRPSSGSRSATSRAACCSGRRSSCSGWGR